MKSLIIKDLLYELKAIDCDRSKQSFEYFHWIGPIIANFADEFVEKNDLSQSYFITRMNKIFKTVHFEVFLKRWLVEYLLKILGILDANCHFQLKEELVLEDNPLNRFAVGKYHSKFGILPKIKWENSHNLSQRILSILLRSISIVYLSLDRGIEISLKRKKYKIMREALWGLYDVRGYHFHDDFMVDGKDIKKEDLILFSRGIPKESGRLKAYCDAKKSPYAHFDILSLSMGVDTLFMRVIPKYVISGSKAIFAEALSPHFSLFWSVFAYFIYNALLYEKIFSHFEIKSELGHNYFSGNHIAEAIICHNYQARYYLMHLSDHSTAMNSYSNSFLACDRFLLWGRVHIQAAEKCSPMFMPIGYVFKRFIKEIAGNRDKVLSDIGIPSKGKIISFFDETFGSDCGMTEENYVAFWETALRLAVAEKDNTIVIKPKSLETYYNLSGGLKKRFLDLKDTIKNMPNMHIIDSNRWSFIEVIGVSNIVVTQGMTSSATIAIICGIEGLYLDEAREESHPFSKNFKDKIVFDNPERLLSMVQKIIAGIESPLKNIPEDILRAYDEYPDDRGIDLFRNVLSGVGDTEKRIGIIVQARMGATRLPGKVMKLISDRPALEILIERLKRSKAADVLIIATTDNENDDAVAKLANSLGVVCFRGSEEDVLSRFYLAAKQNNLDVIVRITSDCPFSDPDIIDLAVEEHIGSKADYTSNSLEAGYPQGLDVEVLNFDVLEKVYKNAQKDYQREHVTPYIYENPKIFKIQWIKPPAELYAPDIRITLDTQEDYMLLCEAFHYLQVRSKNFTAYDVVNLFKEKPHLKSINNKVVQKKIFANKNLSV